MEGQSGEVPEMQLASSVERLLKGCWHNSRVDRFSVGAEWRGSVDGQREGAKRKGASHAALTSSAISALMSLPAAADASGSAGFMPSTCCRAVVTDMSGTSEGLKVTQNDWPQVLTDQQPIATYTCMHSDRSVYIVCVPPVSCTATGMCT